MDLTNRYFHLLSRLGALMLVLSAAHSRTAAQHITFEDPTEYAAVGVYDCWEQSPFRTGAVADIHRYAGLAPNPDTALNTDLNLTPNGSATVVAVQRSRHGSNAFGARVDLPQPLCLGTATKYVHVLLFKPLGEETQAMLVGLGKRQDWPAQEPETEQFWVPSTSSIKAGQWNDLVFPITTNESVDIHSLVLVPDLSSPHLRTEDFVAYVDDIEINDSPKPRFQLVNYPLNFEATQTPVRSDRQLTALTITATGESLQRFNVPTSTIYNNLTASQTIKAKAGSTLKVRMNYKGVWMSGYVYVDWNNDGQFTPEITDNKAAEGSELISYTFLDGYNSLGEQQANGNSVSNGVIACPAFTIPSGTQPGIYRMRFKVDWDSDDAGGNSNTGNLITNNGGGVVDVLLNVHEDSVRISANQLNGDVLSAEGAALSDARIPFGKTCTIKMAPAPGFTYTGVVVTHGYQLDGPQTVRDNRQFQTDTIPSAAFDPTTHEYTLPATTIDGEVRIEGLFTPAPDAVGNLPADGTAADATRLYSLDGRQLAAAPEKGVFILSTKHNGEALVRKVSKK